MGPADPAFGTCEHRLVPASGTANLAPTGPRRLPQSPAVPVDTINPKELSWHTEEPRDPLIPGQCLQHVWGHQRSPSHALPARPTRSRTANPRTLRLKRWCPESEFQRPRCSPRARRTLPTCPDALCTVLKRSRLEIFEFSLFVRREKLPEKTDDHTVAGNLRAEGRRDSGPLRAPFVAPAPPHDPHMWPSPLKLTARGP